jgi:formylglycine-generating enzyme
MKKTLICLFAMFFAAGIIFSACARAKIPTQYTPTAKPTAITIDVKALATQVAARIPKISLYPAIQTQVAVEVSTVGAIATVTAIPAISNDAKVALTTVANAVRTEIALVTGTQVATIMANAFALETAVIKAAETQVAIATRTTVPEVSGHVNAILTVVANAVHTQEALTTQTPVETLGNIYALGTALVNVAATMQVIATETVIPQSQADANAIGTTVAQAAKTAGANITQTIVPTLNAYVNAIETAAQTPPFSSSAVATQVVAVYETAVATVIAAGNDAYTVGMAAAQTAVAEIFYSGLASVSGPSYTQIDPVSGEYFDHQVSSFWIGKYEVTYELWYKVRQWAESNGYVFVNVGSEGSGGGAGAVPTAAKKQPVTNISWSDAIVWCNAYSELESLQPYYTYLGSVIKDATDSTALSNVETNWTSGYRLPTEGEWQFAASEAGSLPPVYLSGASADYNDVAACGLVAWTVANSSGTTHDAGTKSPNTIGVYDMAGNVVEWCWDWYDVYPDPLYGTYYDYMGPYSGTQRIVRGGSYADSAYYSQLGYRNYVPQGAIDTSLGFRVARNY